MKRLARMILFYTAIIAIWVIVAKMRLWPPYMFPPPWGVWESLKTGFQDHSFWIAISTTMKRMLIGYSLSVVLGMILGLGLSSNKFLQETLGGLRRKPAVPAQHLLGTTRGAVVRTDREGHFVCGAHGVVALGNDRYGRWSKADAEDLRHGWAATWEPADSSSSGTCCCRQACRSSSPD